MKPRTKALTAAVAGTALGIGGLAVLAMPAGAGEAPELPEITAERLVESVLTAEPPAFNGTVAIDNDLGLPAVPGMPNLDFDAARVYHDGDDGARLSVEDGTSEYTVVKNGTTVWRYDSAENTATRVELPQDPAEHVEQHKASELADPSAAATEIIGRLSETSEIAIDGTARVAERPVYELVLSPKPDERTLLREIKVAIDYETRMPLRIEVLPNGSPDPVVSVAFTDFTVGDQAQRLFEFTPPEGAKVVEEEAGRPQRDGTYPAPSKEQAEQFGEAGESIDAVGEGWDTVLTGTLPEGGFDRATEQGTDPRALLDQVGERIEGDFGSGYLITMRAGGGIVTDDGRFAIGAVPQQVLIEALETR